MSVVGLCVVFIPGWVGAGKVAEPIGILPLTLHSPAYKDGTDSEFRNVGN